jgi:hypothetical protein
MGVKEYRGVTGRVKGEGSESGCNVTVGREIS